jgi:hypothetical protein
MGKIVEKVEGKVEPEFPWVTLEEDKEEEFQRVMLFYGRSGVGKTKLAAQFWVNDLPPLILGFDPGELGGSLSALEYKPLHMKVNNYEYLMDGLFPMLKEHAGKKFGCVVVDSASYMARMVMASILRKINKEIPRFEEWNLLAERMRKICVTFTELPCHVIFTAVDVIQKDEITGGLFGGPDLPGKLAKELPQHCDVIAKLEVNSELKMEGKKAVRVGVYTYTVVGDATYVAKDRTGLLEATGPTEFESFKVLFKNPKEE